MKVLCPDAILQKESDYTVYELPFARDGMEIYGNLYLPNAAAQTYPTVIIGHGFGDRYTSLIPHAELLAKHGLACYIFDFCGGSTSSRSAGSMLDMSVLTEKEDMRAVLDGLCQYGFVDRDRLFLMGESQGGMVAALLAEERGAEIRGLVLIYPAFVIPDDARAAYPSPEAIPEQGAVFEIPVGHIYFADVLDMDIAQVTGKYSGPVLFLHGDEDPIVPLSYSQSAVKRYPQAELVVLKGAGHGLVGAFRGEAEERILKFLLPLVQ